MDGVGTVPVTGGSTVSGSELGPDSEPEVAPPTTSVRLEGTVTNSGSPVVSSALTNLNTKAQDREVGCLLLAWSIGHFTKAKP